MLKTLRSQIIILFILPFFLISCTSIDRKALTIPQRSCLKQSELLVCSHQHNIHVLLDDNAGAYPDPIATTIGVNPGAFASGAGLVGGLIGAMIITGIDEHELKVLNKEIIPLRQQAQDLHFSTMLQNSIKEKLRANRWIKIQNTAIKYNLSKNEKNYLFASQPNHTLLLISPQFGLNQALNMLYVTITVSLEQKTNKNDSPTVLFSNHYTYVYALTLKQIKEKEAISLWQTNDLLKKSLKESVPLLADMVTTDINIPLTPIYPTINSKGLYFATPFGLKTGKVVKKIGPYLIMRADDDNLFAINSIAIRK